MEYEYLLKRTKLIRLENVKSHLNKTGWKLTLELKEILVYRRKEPEFQYDEVILPKSDIDIFYTQTILDTISRLAKFEKRRIEEIFYDLGVVVKKVPDLAWCTLAPYANSGEPDDLIFIEGYATCLKQGGYLSYVDVKRLIEFVKPLKGLSEVWSEVQIQKFFEKITE